MNSNTTITANGVESNVHESNLYSGWVNLSYTTNVKLVDGSIYVSSADVYSYFNKIFCANTITEYENYYLGEGSEPNWVAYEQYDEDYVYDENAEATAADYLEWNKFSVLSRGSEALSYTSFIELSDVTTAYNHYRDGNREDLIIDYEKVYSEDSNIKSNIDQEIKNAQIAVEYFYETSGKVEFQMHTDLLNIESNYYPATENWQKTIGAHCMWVEANIKVVNSNEISMNIVVHELDRYNFNQGMVDITTEIPDDVNGRFAVLGWANSFNTKGQIDRMIIWEYNHIDESIILDNNQGR